MPKTTERTEYRVVAHGERLPLTEIEGPQSSLRRARATLGRSSARNARIQKRTLTPWADLDEGEG